MESDVYDIKYFVLSELDLIVVSHAGNFENEPEEYLFGIIKDIINPAVIN